MKPKHFLIALHFTGTFITTNQSIAMEYSEKVAICNDYAISKMSIWSSTTNYDTQAAFNLCMQGNNAEKILQSIQTRKQQRMRESEERERKRKMREEEKRRKEELEFQDALGNFQ